jgi:hypothetical protein
MPLLLLLPLLVLVVLAVLAVLVFLAVDVLRLANTGRRGFDSVVVKLLVVLRPLLFVTAFPFQVEVR